MSGDVDLPDGLFDLADMLAQARDEKQRISDELKSVNGMILAVEERMNAVMLEEEMPRFTRAGRTFYVTTKRYVRASPDMRVELYQWLRDHGYDAVVQETINANTLRATVNEIIDESGGVPDDLAPLIVVDEVPTVGVRRGS